MTASYKEAARGGNPQKLLPLHLTSRSFQELQGLFALRALEGGVHDLLTDA